MAGGEDLHAAIGKRLFEARIGAAFGEEGAEFLPLHLQTSLAYLGYKKGDFPISEAAANEVLALPMYPELREDEQQTVVDAIATFYA